MSQNDSCATPHRAITSNVEALAFAKAGFCTNINSIIYLVQAGRQRHFFSLDHRE